MVLEGITRKVEQLHEQLVYYDKYLEEYDGVSLSSFTLSEGDNTSQNLLHLPQIIEGSTPTLIGWEKLYRDLIGILDEGYLQLIQFYQEMDVDISSQIQDRYRVAFSHNLVHSSSEPSNPNSSIDPLQSAQKNEETSSKLNDPIELSILHKELRFNLRRIHELLSEIMEEKLQLLQRTNRIVDYYQNRTAEIGSHRGVLNASRKLEFILLSKKQSLLHHRFFSTQEEESRQQTLQSYWSSLYLGSDKFMNLAGKALAKSIYHREAAFLDWTTHLKIGGVIILLLWSVSECLNNESYLTIWNDPTFAVFVCFGDLLLLLLMWTISMHVWKSSGIDFIRLLQLQETEIGQSKYPVSLVLKSLTDDCLIFLLTFILFNKTIRGAHRGQFRLAIAHMIPVLLTIYYCHRFFTPFHSSRKQWLFMLWKVLASPFYAIEFRDGYIGDLLTSLVRVSVPFLFSLLYVILSVIAWVTNNLDWAVTTSNTWWSEYKLFHFGIIPWLMLYPLWIRFVQCLRRSIETEKRWPHYANALKYTSALLVISYGSFQPELRTDSFWILCFVCATIYQFLWDIFQDWGMITLEGLSSLKDEDNWSLVDLCAHLEKIRFSFRRKRLLGSIWVYLMVMIFNLAFRFAWTLTLLPPVDPKEHGFSVYSVVMYHIGTLIAALEIIRRMVWGFFRLEYEQIEMMKKANLEILGSDELKPSMEGLSSSGKEKLFDGSVLDQMEVSSGRSYGIEEFYSFSITHDWTAYLPNEINRLIDWIPNLTTRRKRIMMIECIFFATIIFYSIFTLAVTALSQ